jgi:hypothetical protein
MPELKVGQDLAMRVAKRLRMNCDLMYSHRDYCGTGLTWSKGTFIYGRVYDGYMHQEIKSFDKEHEFVSWLSEQSDATLNGSDETDAFFRNNQRLTHHRLYEFVSSKPIPRVD